MFRWRNYHIRYYTRRWFNISIFRKTLLFITMVTIHVIIYIFFYKAKVLLYYIFANEYASTYKVCTPTTEFEKLLNRNYWRKCASTCLFLLPFFVFRWVCALMLWWDELCLLITAGRTAIIRRLKERFEASCSYPFSGELSNFTRRANQSSTKSWVTWCLTPGAIEDKAAGPSGSAQACEVRSRWDDEESIAWCKRWIVTKKHQKQY